jgi:hypothetical protein
VPPPLTGNPAQPPITRGRRQRASPTQSRHTCSRLAAHRVAADQDKERKYPNRRLLHPERTNSRSGSSALSRHRKPGRPHAGNRSARPMPIRCRRRLRRHSRGSLPPRTIVRAIRARLHVGQPRPAAARIPVRVQRHGSGRVPRTSGCHAPGFRWLPYGSARQAARNIRTFCAQRTAHQARSPLTPNRRSEIVRAKDNVPARHARRPRGVCCGPPAAINAQAGGAVMASWQTARHRPYRAGPWRRACLRPGHRRQAPAFHWHARSTGEFLSRNLSATWSR